MSDEPLHVWTGLRWFLDTNAIDNPALDDLVRLREQGWVWLSVADIARVEIDEQVDPQKYALLRARLDPFDMALGVFTLGHSELDYAVLAGDDDEARHRAVFELLWPTNDYERDGASNGVGKRRFRDSMHVDTAIRYGGTGLVTQDLRVLKRADFIRERFNGFAIVSVTDAVELSKEAARRVRRAAAVQGKPEPSTIPAWPD